MIHKNTLADLILRSARSKAPDLCRLLRIDTDKLARIYARTDDFSATDVHFIASKMPSAFPNFSTRVIITCIEEDSCGKMIIHFRGQVETDFTGILSPTFTPKKIAIGDVCTVELSFTHGAMLLTYNN